MVLRDIVFVSDEDNGVALAMQVLEKRHDFVAGLGIKVSGRLVGQHDRWRVD